ncbi:MAG: hypothetical protein JNN01_15505 [Opitutaceae bacterium]|nr:hypothetical protein [Opitutaceae bacterium]
MKMKLLALPLLAALALTVPVSAAEKTKDHDHDHGHSHAKKEVGPNGGRLLTAIEPHVEFFVTADRKVQITFLDASDRPVAPTSQVVTVTTGQRSAPTKLSFAKSGGVLLSDIALPAGNELPTVVQIRLAPGGKLVTEKFNLNLAQCAECKHPEYACTCAEH